MHKCFLTLGVTALALMGAQTPTPPAAGAQSRALTRVMGEVVAVDAESRLMTVKADKGENQTLVLEEDGAVLLVPPGETTLEKAKPIPLAEVNRGDKVYARGQPLPESGAIPVRQLVVMSKAAIEKKRDTEREEWQRRGILGTVGELRPKTKEIVLQSRARFGAPAAVAVQVTDKTAFRRYAPDSVKFSEAKPSTLAELKAGDQLRALGEKSADGNTYKADQIVFGTFRTFAGTVTAVNAENNEIKVKRVDGGQTLTVMLNKDSSLRRFPKEFAALMAQRMMGPGPGGPAGPPRGGTPPTGGTPPAGGATIRRAGGDDLLDRLPPVTLAEIKAGDTVLVFSTAGKDPTRATAIAFVSGVEAFLQAMQAMASVRGGPAPGMTLGLPGGALDMGIGLP